MSERGTAALQSSQNSVDQARLLECSLNSWPHVSGLLCGGSVFLILHTQNPTTPVPPQGLGFMSAEQESF